MKRRDFLKLTGTAAMAASVNVGEIASASAHEDPPADGTSAFHVSSRGDDRNPGSAEQPFATLHRAQRAVRHIAGSGPVTIWVHRGTYYLDSPLDFAPPDSGRPNAPIVWSAWKDDVVTLSGGQRLSCQWIPHEKGILKASVPAGLEFTQLFVNGKRQIRARYPNYDPTFPGRSGYLSAVDSVPPDAESPYDELNRDMTYSSEAPRGVHFDPDTFIRKKWSNTKDAEIHIFQQAYWGNLQWEIKGIDHESNSIWFGRGGQQIGAKWDPNPARVGKGSRFFIENVLEELDAPGEWFFDKPADNLFFYPRPGEDMRTAVIEVPRHESIVRFSGSQDSPVTCITIKGFRFAHTVSTYMARYDVPSLSDWSIHRGGTILAEGTRDCSIQDCWFDAIGGNGVFVNNYNREFAVSCCKFTETGDSAICFVGDLAQTIGSQRSFPYECTAHNNLVHDCGFFGKQIAAVYISRAKRITVSNNLIYNMPRAGICIGDSTWGGHVVEFNETHDTVLETSDHGPFNAWGRDRAWSLAESHAPYTHDRSIDAWDVLVDAMEPVIVRNNLFNEKSGWGLDLDDGASNYRIYNNISMGGVSFKWREGAYREVFNNIWYKSRVAPCFHVDNAFNHDRYYNNITLMEPGDVQFPAGAPWWPQMFHSIVAPPVQTPWFEEVDRNLFFATTGEFQAVVDELRTEDGKRSPKRYNLAEWQALGWDKNSVFADPLFVDPEKRDFRVRADSPALKLGFVNFEMGKWGITDEFPRKWLSEEAGDPPARRSLS